MFRTKAQNIAKAKYIYEINELLSLGKTLEEAVFSFKEDIQGKQIFIHPYTQGNNFYDIPEEIKELAKNNKNIFSYSFLMENEKVIGFTKSNLSNIAIELKW